MSQKSFNYKKKLELVARVIIPSYLLILSIASALYDPVFSMALSLMGLFAMKIADNLFEVLG